MAKRAAGAMHVAKVVSRQKGREYTSWLLRQSFREEGRVKHRTLANLSMLPPTAITAIGCALRGSAVGPLDDVETIRSLKHGNVLAALGTLRRLGVEQLLGRRCRERDLCVAMIAARLLQPSSKLHLSRSWRTSTLAEQLGVADATEDELYAAMDWLFAQQEKIEKQLADRHLSQGCLILYDLSSSYMEGTKCPLAKRGYSRDGKRGTLQIEYGLVTDHEGRPIAIEVFEGNTGDPSTVAVQVEKVQKRFGLKDVILVGDRGMLTAARIEKLKEVGGLQWVSSLRAPQIRALVEGGTLQLSLFDERNLAEIIDPAYPGERLVVCRNPALAEERGRKRQELLAATEVQMAPIIKAVDAGRLTGEAQIALRVGKVLNKYKMAKHFDMVIADSSLVLIRKVEAIAAEAALDGFYVLRTSVEKDMLTTVDVVRTYKQLKVVERAFHCLKSVDMQIRPIHHRLEDRVRGHILLCMLAYYVRWKMEKDWAPLLFRDEEPVVADDPVVPAVVSAVAMRKARTGRLADGTTTHSFRSLMEVLENLTRNQVRFRSAPEAGTVEMTSTPTALQQRALSLLSLNAS